MSAIYAPNDLTQQRLYLSLKDILYIKQIYTEYVNKSTIQNVTMNHIMMEEKETYETFMEDEKIYETESKA